MTAVDRPAESLWHAVVRRLALDELAGPPKPGSPPAGLILPSPPATAPTHAPLDLLAQVQRAPVISAGLAPRPQRTPPRPLDFYGVFLALKNDFGMETTQDRIDAALAMLPMSEVLWILAQLANRADQAGRDGQLEVAQQLLPAPLLPRALQLVSSPPRVVTSPQLVLQLGLRALLHCDPSGPPLLAENGQVGRLGPLQ